MKITKTKFKDLIIIEQEKFIDHRGELRITFHQKNLNFNKFLFEYSVIVFFLLLEIYTRNKVFLNLKLYALSAHVFIIYKNINKNINKNKMLKLWRFMRVN